MGMIVYGANCIWWDDKEKCGLLPIKNGQSLPCCPYCRSVLFEIEEERWWHAVDAYTKLNDPNYRALIEWQRGKCFKNIKEAREAYERERKAAAL